MSNPIGYSKPLWEDDEISEELRMAQRAFDAQRAPGRGETDLMPGIWGASWVFGRDSVGDVSKL